MPKLEISRVHDAYAQGGICPLCTLMDGAERTYLFSFQHSRVMEPNVRVKTNAVGFCPDHLGKLYQGENKLGLGLVVLTHLQEKTADLQAALDGTIEAARAGGRERTRRIQQIIGSLESYRDSCFICGLLSQDLTRYAWTILYLWRKDPEFPAKLRASRGFCLSHFCTVLAAASDLLRGERLEQWLDDAVSVMKRSLDELEKDLMAFTQLHQAGNTSLGTDQVRTALARTLQMLAGRVQRQ
jgi:Family of unknown function (DUF6062)